MKIPVGPLVCSLLLGRPCCYGRRRPRGRSLRTDDNQLNEKRWQLHSAVKLKDPAGEAGAMSSCCNAAAQTIQPGKLSHVPDMELCSPPPMFLDVLLDSHHSSNLKRLDLLVLCLSNDLSSLGIVGTSESPSDVHEVRGPCRNLQGWEDGVCARLGCGRNNGSCLVPRQLC